MGKKTWLEEVIEAQNTPSFREWLSGMDQHIAWFREAVLPDFDGDLSSIEAVEHAEQKLLELFPSRDAMRNDPNSDVVAEGFARFVGNAFVKGLGGQWVNLPSEGYPLETIGYSAAVATRSNGERTIELAMIPTINATVARRTGTEFRRIWNKALANMSESGLTPETNSTDLIAEMRQIPDAIDLDEYRPKHPDVRAVAFLPPGRTITQKEARGILERNTAPDGMVIEENPHSIAAKNPITGQTIGLLLNTQGVSDNITATWLPELLKNDPHRLAAQFDGATEAVEVYIDNDPDEELVTPLFIMITDDLESEYGALIRIEEKDIWLTD